MEGIGAQLTFYGFAAVIVASAFMAATMRSIVHAAFSLIATFFGVAAIYAILGSDFLAITQAVVYIGGILILLVFGVLLTDRVPEPYRVTRPRSLVPAVIVAGLVFVDLAWASMSTQWPHLKEVGIPEGTTVRQIGTSLLTDYLIPFEFASVLLLVVLVGAARMARGGTR